MKTNAFLNRLLRPLSLKSLESATANQILELVDAMNHSLTVFYGMGPRHHREYLTSYTLRAPAEITGLSMTSGSTTFPFTDNNGRYRELDLGPGEPLQLVPILGCSVKIEGDERWNRIISPGKLMYPYRGASGTRTATIYSDAVVLEAASIEAVLNDPRLDTGEILSHEPMMAQYGADLDGFYHRNGSAYYGYQRTPDRNTGRPLRYFSMHVGDRESGFIDPQGILILDPVPVEEHTLVFEARHLPLRFGIEAMQTPVSLPVADHLVESIMIPLAMEALIGSDLWRDRRNEEIYARRGDAARAMLYRQDEHVVTPRNTCGTEEGW